MKVITILFGIFAAIIDLILVIVSIAVPEDSMWLGVIILTITVVGLFYSANQITKNKKADLASKLARNTPFMDDIAISMIESGKLPTVSNTPVLLTENEIAHFYAPATKIVTKNRAIGKTGNGAGVRVRVAKGVSVSTGGGSSRTIFGEVSETYSGSLVLTNKRIVFIHSQSGFECKISSLTAVTPVGDSIVIQAGSKTYQFFVARQDLFVSAFSMVTQK